MSEDDYYKKAFLLRKALNKFRNDKQRLEQENEKLAEENAKLKRRINELEF